MIRVSGNKERLGRSDISAEKLDKTRELLADIRDRVQLLVEEQMRILREDILPDLARNGIKLSRYSELTASEKTDLDEYFDTNVYPLLTPQAVDPTHPFPYISGGSINVALFAKPDTSYKKARQIAPPAEQFFVRIKIPPSVPNFVPVPEAERMFVRVEDLIVANVEKLVPGSSPAACHCFRITRDADIEVREAETEDLVEAMEENLIRRRFGDVVRLEVSSDMPSSVVAGRQKIENQPVSGKLDREANARLPN